MANKILGRSMAAAILAFFMQAAVPALAIRVRLAGSLSGRMNLTATLGHNQVEL